MAALGWGESFWMDRVVHPFRSPLRFGFRPSDVRRRRVVCDRLGPEVGRIDPSTANTELP